MPDMTDYAPGTPCWVDVTSPDLDATTTFYSQLFGWRAERDPRPEAGGYTMLSLNGRSVAAAGPPMQEGIPPVWTTYLATDDVDAAAERVRAAGGTLLAEPFDVLEAGRMAVVQDPTGAVFGVWQAGQHHGAQVVNEPGALSWNECVTSDPAAAADFYRAVFGYTVTETTMAGAPYHLLQVDGRSVAGISQTDSAPSHWATTFNVADTDATCARADELGARVLTHPTDLPEIGRYATLQDPVGATFGVIQDPPG